MKGSLPELAASSSSILQRQLLGWRSFHIPWSSLDTVLTVKHFMPLPLAFLGFARVSLLHLQEHRAGAASAGASKRIARDPPPPVALAGQALGLLSGGVGDARHHLRPNATGGTKNGKEMPQRAKLDQMMGVVDLTGTTGLKAVDGFRVSRLGRGHTRPPFSRLRKLCREVFERHPERRPLLSRCLPLVRCSSLLS